MRCETRGRGGAVVFCGGVVFCERCFFRRPAGDQAGEIGLGGVGMGDKIIYLGFYLMGWWAFLLLGRVFFTHGLMGMRLLEHTHTRVPDG